MTIGDITGITSLLGIIYFAGFKQARMETMLQKLWKDNETWTDFHLRRAWSEAFQKNIAEINSPPVITVEAQAWIQPLADELRNFYVKLGRNLSERELWMEIERRFGDRLLKEVCIPRKLSQGACILIAMQAVKE